ncbi:MAG: DUF3102 domain-containing protein [Oscillibacter sp.]|nr:DUF3102 domain-containing protein [Oscillibacter sp.]
MGKAFDIAAVFGATNIVNVPISAQRDLTTVTAEIRTLHRSAQGMILNYAIEIGRRLKEAKEMIPHGQWGDYLKSEVDYSQRTANNFMQIFEEYGDKQVSLFGDPNSQTFANLPYTHALKLLAIPEDEREEFAEENHVEDLSARELDKLIKERDEAINKAAAAESDVQAAKDTALAAQDNVANLQKKLELAERNRDAARDELQKAGDAKAKAEEAAKKAKDQLKELKSNPEIPSSVMDEIRKKEAEAAKAAAEKELTEKLAEVETAEKKAASAIEQAEVLKKQLALSDPDTAIFKTYFSGIQEDLNRLYGVMLKIRSTDTEKAEKLSEAVLTLLAQSAEVWKC